jgi:Spy/CpxP family protein refolding chaperone
MKKLAIILTLLLIGSISTRPAETAAQEPTAPAAPPAPNAQTAPDAPNAPQMPEQARQRLEQVKERLKLTPEQVEQVRPILTEEVQKLRALRESNPGGGSRRDRLKMARELKRIQDDADDRLKKILTKEQMNELKKLREERRAEMRERAGR